MIDWGFLLTFVLIGVGAWMLIAFLGALLIGRSIRLADQQEGNADDETPDPLPTGPGSRRQLPSGDGRGARPGR